MDVALEILRSYGFPAFCLCAVGWALWRVVRWTGTEIIKPLFQRLMRFIDSAESLFTRQSEDVGEIKSTLARVERVQRDHLRVCQSTAESGTLAPDDSAAARRTDTPRDDRPAPPLLHPVL